MSTGDKSSATVEGKELWVASDTIALLTLDYIGLMQVKFVNASYFWHADVLAKTRSLLGEAFKIPIKKLSVGEDNIVNN